MKENMTNPLTIMLINMTIVFAVLYSLGWVIKFIRYIDPTRKREAPEPASVPAPAPAAVTATVATTAEAQQEEDELEVAAVIAAALAANEDELEIAAAIAAALAVYGLKAHRIVSVRPAIGQAWARAARLEVVNTRSQLC